MSKTIKNIPIKGGRDPLKSKIEYLFKWAVRTNNHCKQCCYVFETIVKIV